MEVPFVVEGNVDIRTGDIDSAGDVVVKGDVQSGRVIKAGGSVIVSGVVEAAAITSGGDVSVQCGIAGRGKGRVQARGRITIGYVNKATLESGSGLVIGSSALNSTLLTDGDVLVEGEGVIVGGVVMAGGSLTARSIGHKGADLWDKSKRTTTHIVEKTVVMLGLPPGMRKDHLESRSRLSLAENVGRTSARNVEYLTSRGIEGLGSETAEQAAFAAKAPISEAFLLSKGQESALEANEELRNIVASIAQKLPLPSRHPELADSRIQNLALQLYHLYAANKFVIDLSREEQERLQSPRLNLDAELCARDIVYEGVEITIGFRDFSVNHEMSGTVFKLVEGEIAAQPFVADTGKGN
ncbi:MAG: DUF342 domain-containing protein [Candidatus Coatesbacteria bacterium]|nr:DUF342 domain-containing protein [Candidatus Coatesbacteria bacterium]